MRKQIWIRIVISVVLLTLTVLTAQWWNVYRGPLEAEKSIQQLSDSPTAAATALWWVRYGVAFNFLPWLAFLVIIAMWVWFGVAHVLKDKPEPAEAPAAPAPEPPPPPSKVYVSIYKGKVCLAALSPQFLTEHTPRLLKLEASWSYTSQSDDNTLIGVGTTEQGDIEIHALKLN